MKSDEITFIHFTHPPVSAPESTQSSSADVFSISCIQHSSELHCSKHEKKIKKRKERKKVPSEPSERVITQKSSVSSSE